MKKIIIAMLAITLCFMSAFADDSTIKLEIINHKGRPVNGTDIYVFINGTTKIMHPDRKGHLLINDVKETDTVNIIVGRSFYKIPAAGLNSVGLVLRNDKLTSSDPRINGIIDTGYSKISSKNNPLPATVLKIESTSGYSNLADYLQGRVAGLRIVHEGGIVKAYIRGPSSIMLDNSALVVIDGVVVDSFDRANNMLNVSDIESVSVLKDGSMYGVRGSNGVIVITTKTGK